MDFETFSIKRKDKLEIIDADTDAYTGIKQLSETVWVFFCCQLIDENPAEYPRLVHYLEGDLINKKVNDLDAVCHFYQFTPLSAVEEYRDPDFKVQYLKER